MDVVGIVRDKVGSLISQSVTIVAAPFHPFGGALDIIVVERDDGTFRSTPWCVQFGKFQGVLKGREKEVRISVNGIEADLHMYLDRSGQAYFLKEVESEEDASSVSIGEESFRSATDKLDLGELDNINEEDLFVSEDGNQPELDAENNFYSFKNYSSKQLGSLGLEDDVATPTGAGFQYQDSQDIQMNNEHDVEGVLEPKSPTSNVILMTGDGHLITAPVSASEVADIDLSPPQFLLLPQENPDMNIEEVQEPVHPGDILLGSGMSSENRTSRSVQFMSTNSSSYIVEQTVDQSKDTIGEPPFCDVLQLDYERSSIASDKGDNVGTYSRTDLIVGSTKEGSETAVLAEDKLNGIEILMPTQESNSENLEHGSQNSPSQPKIDYPSNVEANPEIRPVIDDGAEFHGEPNADVKERSEPSLAEQLENSSSVLPSRIESETLKIECTPSSLVSGDHSDQQIDKFLQGQDPLEHTVSKNKTSEHNNDQGLSNVSSQELETDCVGEVKYTSNMGVEISLCGNLLHPGIGCEAAEQAFDTHRVSEEVFQDSGASITKNKNLIVRCKNKYLPWKKAAPIVLGMTAFNIDFPADPEGAILVEQKEVSSEKRIVSRTSSFGSRHWGMLPIPFMQVRKVERIGTSSSSEDGTPQTGSLSRTSTFDSVSSSLGNKENSSRKLLRTNIPTSEQLAALNLKEGQNDIAFTFTTMVLGKHQVDARIYLWKSNARIVVSDVDGTITRSDVLGQVMPLLGRDWTQSGVARLFSAVKENGYQLLFLSARAITQAYLTRDYLQKLKQDGKALPSGPVLISPDGLSQSLFREVVVRKPHEFKIQCLQEIRSLFPEDYNPFYAGFGNRDTDEISYIDVGIPKGKIFIINPKGEIAVNNLVASRTYTSLHTLVNDVFPPTSVVEPEDYNSWNYWKIPLPNVLG